MFAFGAYSQIIDVDRKMIGAIQATRSPTKRRANANVVAAPRSAIARWITAASSSLPNASPTV